MFLEYTVVIMLLLFSFAFSGCSCGGPGQKDAVDYDNVRKNTAAIRPGAEAQVQAPAGAAKTDQPPVKSAETPVQKILGEARKNGKIDVKPAAPGCEAGREKLKKALKEFKFDRDFNGEPIASVVKELSGRTGFKFKADPDLAEKKLTMRSSGRKFLVFIREIERMGVRIILSPENDILLKSGEERGGRGFARGAGKRDGAERSGAGKSQAGTRPNPGGSSSHAGDSKNSAQDVDVFDDTDIF